MTQYATLVRFPHETNDLVEPEIVRERVDYSTVSVDMQPPIGMSPDLEWLMHFTPYVEIDPDTRYYVLNVVRTITDEPHPDYPAFRQYRITYELQRRPHDDTIRIVDDMEAERVNAMIDPIKRDKLQWLYTTVTNRRARGLSLTPKMIAFEEWAQNVAQKIWQNETLRDDVAALIRANNEPDLDLIDWQS